MDTGTAELIDTVQQERGEPAPETERVQTEDGAVDFEVGADEEQFNMGFPQGSENASPSEPFSDSSKSFANSLSPRADQLRAKGEMCIRDRPSSAQQGSFAQGEGAFIFDAVSARRLGLYLSLIHI